MVFNERPLYMLARAVLQERQQSNQKHLCEGRKSVWYGKYTNQLNVAKFVPKTRFRAFGATTDVGTVFNQF